MCGIVGLFCKSPELEEQLGTHLAAMLEQMSSRGPDSAGVDADADVAENWVRRRHPRLRVMSAGQVIELYKETGRPETFVEQFSLGDLGGTHALGHTRM